MILLKNDEVRLFNMTAYPVFSPSCVLSWSWRLL